MWGRGPGGGGHLENEGMDVIRTDGSDRVILVNGI